MHAEWPQDFLHDHALVNHGNHPHEVLADWATERVQSAQNRRTKKLPSKIVWLNIPPARVSVFQK